MLTAPVTPELARSYHDVLVQQRAWLEHFKADILSGLQPYPDSIDAAIAGINDVIGEPFAREREGA